MVKYRGTTHGTNEYPFLIDEDGISVWPVTSLQLERRVQRTHPHRHRTARRHAGRPGLLARKQHPPVRYGWHGQDQPAAALATSRAAAVSDAVLLLRGIARPDYPQHEQHRPRFAAVGEERASSVPNLRPFHFGLEMHLARTMRLVAEFDPQVVIVDQMSGLETTGTPLEIKSAMMRLIDFLKLKGITAMYTDLTMDGNPVALTNTAICSLVDTWLILRDLELNGERNRGLHIIKSRGMAHSNQVREFIMSEHGIELKDIYMGPSGMLTGSARVAQEALERAQQMARREEVERQQLELKRKHDALEGQIAALRAEFAAEEARIERSISYDKQHEESLVLDVVEMKRSRKHDEVKTSRNLGSRNGGKL